MDRSCQIRLDHPFHASHVACGTLMTTPVEIIASHVKWLAHRAYGYMETLASRLTYYDPESELTTLNQQARMTWHPVSPLLYDILQISEQLEALTHRAFRVDFQGLVTQPNGEHGYELRDGSVRLGKDTILDLSGIAKGYIVDRVFEFLDQQGAQNILVNAGGDMRLRSIETEHPWRIGLINPRDTRQCYGHISLYEGAITTSGTYERSLSLNGERMTHFFDPQQGGYLADPPYTAVTVQGSSAAIAEVCAKCLLMGRITKPFAEHKALGIDKNTQKVMVFN